MKTKVNEVPLVGPKGRKELLRRINELEAQVAQQDYLPIIVASIDTPSGWPVEVFNELNRRFKTGTIHDTIIQDGSGCSSKIIAVEAEDGELLNVTTCYETTLYTYEKPQ